MKNKKRFLVMNIGLIYILPWLVGFPLLKVHPFASSLYYNFTNYDLFSGIIKIGLMNYEKISTDEDAIKAFAATFKYVIFDVPPKLAFVLFIAYILNSKLKGVNFFRTAYYILSILGGSIAIAIPWRVVLNTDGLINMVVAFFGGPKVNWMAGANSALLVTVLLRVWQPGSTMVIFLAASKGVLKDLYEAVSIDRTGKRIQFSKITVPLITPVIFYNLIAQPCQTLQEFNVPFLVIKGGPNGATTLISVLTYNNTLLRYKMGMASAQARVLFPTVIILTAVTFISQKKWVYYSDEEDR